MAGRSEAQRQFQIEALPVGTLTTVRSGLGAALTRYRHAQGGGGVGQRGSCVAPGPRGTRLSRR
jgi:hypothetical protein